MIMVTLEAWFPEADRSRPANTDGGSILGGKPKCIWHDTETDVIPSYSHGFWPHMTIHNGKVYQHIPANRAARALKNVEGGVQTNRWNAFQIEVTGWANKVVYQPIMSRVADWLWEARGVPKTTIGLWYPYPKSYGLTDIRMTEDEWLSFSGHCGHMHVPENLHGDPGWPFPIYPILEGEDMTLDESRMLKRIYQVLTDPSHLRGNAPFELEYNGRIDSVVVPNNVSLSSIAQRLDRIEEKLFRTVE